VLDGVVDSADALKHLKAEQRGWIKGRNECWKTTDKVACARKSYEARIAELQARYFLVEGRDPVFFMCDDSSEIGIPSRWAGRFLPPPARNMKRTSG
jgi:hypothetical protein